MTSGPALPGKRPVAGSRTPCTSDLLQLPGTPPVHNVLHVPAGTPAGMVGLPPQAPGPVLLRAPVTVPLEAELVGDVETFELQFYGPTGGLGAVWPAGGANDTLPQAVEVTLAVKGVGKFKRLFLVNH